MNNSDWITIWGIAITLFASIIGSVLLLAFRIRLLCNVRCTQSNTYDRRSFIEIIRFREREVTNCIRSLFKNKSNVVTAFECSRRSNLCMRTDWRYPRNFYVSLIIPLYFIVAFAPVLMKRESEFFPFFSFKLFSKIPNGFTRYDLVFDAGTDKINYLIYNNKTLNKLERTHFEYWLQSAVQSFQRIGTIDLKSHEYLLEKGKSIKLVKLSGDYIDAVMDTQFDIETVAVLK